VLIFLKMGTDGRVEAQDKQRELSSMARARA
jgi:hypothetical protein